MIGWNPADPGSDQELFTKEELIKRFDFGRVQKSGAVFNIEKLDWFNREYIKMLDQSAFWTHGEKWVPQWVYDIDTKYEMLAKIEYLLRDRIEKFSDIKTLFDAGEFDYFFKDPEVKSEMLVWKQDTLENAKLHLAKAKEIVESVEDWNIDGIKAVLMPYAEEVGKGNVLWPLRVALSGKEKSPDPFEIASIIGKEKTLARIDMVLK
jgi:glutamyl/glutaminyl-tRNA synthetase